VCDCHLHRKDPTAHEVKWRLLVRHYIFVAAIPLSRPSCRAMTGHAVRSVIELAGWMVCTVALSPFRNSRTRSLVLYRGHVSLQGDTRQAFHCGFVPLRLNQLSAVE
jgi:hypothetical protein